MKYEARQQGYKVLGVYTPDEVLPYTGPNASNRLYSSHMVKMTSLRYQTFCKSTKCVCCGIEGTVMLLELPKCKKPVRPHFNFYAKREGKLVQMTKDHKQPKSKGGRDFIGNMQTMCADCNELKGDQHLKGGNEKVLSGLRKIRDGVQVIYMVAPGPYWDDVMDGFATTPKGIARIVEKHHIEYPCFTGPYRIDVDMEAMRVILVEEEFDLSTTYHIFKVERV